MKHRQDLTKKLNQDSWRRDSRHDDYITVRQLGVLDVFFWYLDLDSLVQHPLDPNPDTGKKDPN